MTQILPTTQAEEPLVFITSFVAGEEGAVHSFQFDSETGALKPVHQNKGISNAFFLAISPDNKTLYSIDTPNFGDKENDDAAAFTIDRSTGSLKRLNKQSTRGTTSCYLDVDPSGKTLVVANYSSGSVAAWPIQKDGSIGEAASAKLTPNEAQPFVKIAPGSGPRHLTFHPG